MTRLRASIIAGIIGTLLLSMTLLNSTSLNVPKTWDIKELEAAELPPADSSVKIKFVPESYYYAIPEWEIFKTFQVYAKGFEPKGYLDSLKKLNPVKVYFDSEHIKSQQDWIEAGKAVYNWPVGNIREVDSSKAIFTSARNGVRRPEITKAHVFPMAALFVDQKGLVKRGSLACANCHNRVTADGEVIIGAQGTIQFDAGVRRLISELHLTNEQQLPLHKPLFYAPWVKNEEEIYSHFDAEVLIQLFEAEPAGVITRQGTALMDPVSIPSLIGIKDIKYLDKTGLMRHRGPADLMRYAALNQGMDMLTSYNGYIPLGVKHNSVLPTSKEWNHPYGYAFKRYSDAQLYALTQYIYSLKPPPNPNHFPKSEVQHGQSVFLQQGCVTCHTPPLYTNNQLTPASGYEPSESQLKNFDVFNVSVETDSVLTMQSRRGTGFYKVPSLRGLFYRQNYFHNGRLATLEDVFDEKRLNDTYLPTGCPPPGRKNGAVKGHPFGLELSASEKKDLVKFLKTL